MASFSQDIWHDTCLFWYEFVILHYKKIITMAIPIKQVPILTGEIAEAFVREAEEKESKPHGYRLSPDDEATVRRVIRRMEDFVPAWRKKK